jgi:hypothetical protein
VVPHEVWAFLSRWHGREGRQERANHATFLTELRIALALPQPQPAGERANFNDYVFERVVRETNRDGSISNRRIDLHKRDCFVLDGKQSRQQPAGGRRQEDIEPIASDDGNLLPGGAFTPLPN